LEQVGGVPASATDAIEDAITAFKGHRAAFELLRQRSQNTNTKLRTPAEQLMADFRSLRSPQKACSARLLTS
jgi:hypothetical protein